MGFSTSGSFLVVFVGLFLAFGTVFTAASNTTDRAADAVGDRAETQTEIADTRFNVTEATVDADTGTLEIRVNNTGTTTLSVADTTVLADGLFVDGFDTATVDGAESDLWAPGTQLRLIRTDPPGDPSDRVKIVTATGVADAHPVTEVTN